MSTNIYINLSNNIKMNSRITMHYVEHLTHNQLICTIPIYLIQLINKYLISNNNKIIITDKTKTVNILVLQKDLLNTYSNMKLKLNKSQLGKSYYQIPMSIKYQDNTLNVHLCIKTTMKESLTLFNNNKIRKIMMIKLSKINSDYKYFETNFKMSFNTENNKEFTCPVCRQPVMNQNFVNKAKKKRKAFIDRTYVI